MSKSNAAETSFLQLIFNAVAWADLAENDATSPAANLEVALHTADPGEAGTQLTSEATYIGYVRMDVPRTAGGWTVAGDVASNTGEIAFPEATGGSETLTHFSVGVPGSDIILMSGALTTPRLVNSGVTPRFAVGVMTFTES